MSKDLEIFRKEGARVIIADLHVAHEVYVANVAPQASFYDQPDSSLWDTDTGACNLYQVTDFHLELSICL